MKFTEEEISLCKQVAEKHRKEIKYGDWYWSRSHDKPLLATDGGFKSNEQEHHGVFKIWTPSDCLEFLGEKFERLRFCDDKKFEIQIWLPDGFYCHVGNTPLEAYLKAVLAVLEEKKK